MYRTIFFFINACETRVALPLTVYKRRKCAVTQPHWRPVNSTVKVTKTVSKAFDAFKGHYVALSGYYFALQCRNSAIFAVCKRCANAGFACMCEQKFISQKLGIALVLQCDNWQADSSICGRSAVIFTVYIHGSKNKKKMQFLMVALSWQTTKPVSKICGSSCGDWIWNRRAKRLQSFCGFLRFFKLLGLRWTVIFPLPMFF